MPTSQQQKQAAIAAAAQKAKTARRQATVTASTVAAQDLGPAIPSSSIVGTLLNGQPITQNHELDTTDVNTLLAPYSVLNANDPASAALQTSHFGNAVNGNLVGYVGTASLVETTGSSSTISISVPLFQCPIDLSAIKKFLQANPPAGREPSQTYHFQYALHKQNNEVDAQGNTTTQTGSHFTLLDIAVSPNNEISIINYDTMEDVAGSSIISHEVLAEIKNAVAEGFGIPLAATAALLTTAASSQPSFHFAANNPIQSKLRAPSDCLPGDMQQGEDAGGFSCGYRVAMQVISEVGSDADKAEVGDLRDKMLAAGNTQHTANPPYQNNYEHISQVTQWAAQKLMLDALKKFGGLTDTAITADDLEMPVNASGNITFNAASTATSAPPPPQVQPQQQQVPPQQQPLSSTATSTAPPPTPIPTVTTNEQDAFSKLNEADKKKILEAAFNAVWLKRLGEALTTEELKKNKVTVALSMRYPKAIDGEDKKNEQNIKIEGQSCTLYMKAEYTTPATQGNPLTGAKDTPEKTETVNIALTRTQGKDGKVEWTCISGDSKKVDWALSCRMIAEASLAMRCEQYKEKKLGDGVIPEAIKLELKKDVLDKADEKTKKTRTEDFCNGAELTDKEFALIKAHFDAGYKYVEYAGFVYDRMSPTVRTVQVATEQKQLAMQTHCAPSASAHYTSDGTKTQSLFLPFKMTYHDEVNNPNGMSAAEQARTILDNVRVLQKKGYREVGITYSANQEETAALLAYYADTKNPKEAAFPRLGTNQGAVMKEVLKLLAQDATNGGYNDLEKVFKIIPLTTMKYDAQGNVAVADDASVTASIQNAQKFMDAPNHALLGWQNQSTKTLPADFYSQPNQTAGAAKLGTKYFAVGGGIASTLAKNSEHKSQMAHVQDHLLELAYHHGVERVSTPMAFDKAMDQLTRVMKNVAQTLEFVSHLPEYNNSSDKTYIQQTQACITGVQINLKKTITQLQTDILTAQHTLQNMKDRQSAAVPDEALGVQIKELTQKITDAEKQMKAVSDACQEKIKELETASQNITTAEKKIEIAIGVLKQAMDTVGKATTVEAVEEAMNDVRTIPAILQPIQDAKDAIAKVPQALQGALTAQLSRQETLLQNVCTYKKVEILTQQAVAALEAAISNVKKAQTAAEVNTAADFKQSNPSIESLIQSARNAIDNAIVAQQNTIAGFTSSSSPPILQQQITWLTEQRKHIADAQSKLHAVVEQRIKEIEKINTLIADATQEVAESIASAQRIIDRSNNALMKPLPESISALQKLQKELQLHAQFLQEEATSLTQNDDDAAVQQLKSYKQSPQAQTKLTELQTQIGEFQRSITDAIASNEATQGKITSVIKRLDEVDARAKAEAAKTLAAQQQVPPQQQAQQTQQLMQPTQTVANSKPTVHSSVSVTSVVTGESSTQHTTLSAPSLHTTEPVSQAWRQQMTKQEFQERFQNVKSDITWWEKNNPSMPRPAIASMQNAKYIALQEFANSRTAWSDPKKLKTAIDNLIFFEKGLNETKTSPTPPEQSRLSP